MFDVINIEAHHFFECRITAPRHLPQPSQAWFGGQAAQMPGLIAGHFIGGGGAWSHPAHFAPGDIPQLGQFIEAGTAQQLAHPGTPGIVADFENRAIGFVLGDEFGFASLGVFDQSTRVSRF